MGLFLVQPPCIFQPPRPFPLFFSKFFCVQFGAAKNSIHLVGESLLLPIFCVRFRLNLWPYQSNFVEDSEKCFKQSLNENAMYRSVIDPIVNMFQD